MYFRNDHHIRNLNSLLTFEIRDKHTPISFMDYEKALIKLSEIMCGN